MKKHQILLTIAIALAGTAHAGEPIAPNPPASPVALPFGCAQKSNGLPDLQSMDFGCHVMRQALSTEGMTEFDQTAFLLGMQLRQNQLILNELRQLRERLDAEKGGQK